jgi:hypothetical protein
MELHVCEHSTFLVHEVRMCQGLLAAARWWLLFPGVLVVFLDLFNDAVAGYPVSGLSMLYLSYNSNEIDLFPVRGGKVL